MSGKSLIWLHCSCGSFNNRHQRFPPSRLMCGMFHFRSSVFGIQRPLNCEVGLFYWLEYFYDFLKSSRHPFLFMGPHLNHRHLYYIICRVKHSKVSYIVHIIIVCAIFDTLLLSSDLFLNEQIIFLIFTDAPSATSLHKVESWCATSLTSIFKNELPNYKYSGAKKSIWQPIIVQVVQLKNRWDRPVKHKFT